MMKISEMPKYDDYVDSGVEWLGRVPSHWQIIRLKNTINGCVNGLWGADPNGKDELVVVRVSDFDEQKLNVSDEKLTYRSIPENERKSRLLKFGDLLIEKSGGGDKTLVGRVVLFDKSYTAVTSNFVAKMTPKNWVNHSFLKYVFFSLYSRGVNYVSIKQTTGIQNLDANSYLNEVFCFPDEFVQAEVANFLDKKTALIDEAISIKEQQISLLKERKQIIIQQAVTQGLDPNVPMKDSGVDWIGKVPAHWEVKRIKHAGKIINGYAFPSDAFIQEGARVMKISNIQTMRLDWSDSSYVDALWLTKTNQFRIYKGDLVFALTRPVISTGIKAALVDTDEPILLNQRNAVFRPNDTCDKNWIYFVLLTKGFINDFEMQIDITGQQPNISTVAIGNLSFPLPPELEQKAIVSDLSRRCALLDKAVDDQIAQIEKLKEYKTTLINSAVTGKIKITPEMVEQ